MTSFAIVWTLACGTLDTYLNPVHGMASLMSAMNIFILTDNARIEDMWKFSIPITVTLFTSAGYSNVHKFLYSQFRGIIVP